jgi:hypothetical protein
VSQEESARLREGVPYVKIYRYNPKHLYLKLNGYGDFELVQLEVSIQRLLEHGRSGIAMVKAITRKPLVDTVTD